MRVVHISTFDAGGAGRAALRLHQGLLALGESSLLLVRQKSSANPRVQAVGLGGDLAARGAEFRLGLVRERFVERNRTPVSNTHFSLGYPGWDLAQHPALAHADLIHLHWVADFLSPVSIARLAALGRPMVWTLHDQRAFTGGCHFSAGCPGYQAECAACPQLGADPFGLTRANLRDQIQLLPAAGVTVVCPSQWLADCARRSKVFARARVEVIPYGVETEVFRPVAKTLARQRLRLDPGATCLLFGAHSANERRKGFAQLLEALDRCLEDPGFAARVQRGELMLLCFGQPSDTPITTRIPCRSWGYFESDEQLSLLYAAADLFVLPSLEDNLPNTALESLGCGTPVVAFSVGGVPDLITEGLNGRLVAPGDVRALAHAIVALTADRALLARLGAAGREVVCQRFSLGTQAQAYVRLYEQLAPVGLRPTADEMSDAASRRFKAEPLDEFGPHLGAIYEQLLRATLEENAVAMVAEAASVRERLMLNSYQAQLDEGRAGRWPWVLNPRAWLARGRRNALRRAIARRTRRA